jgi:23S rRNA (adenine2030-N6)-methyltransferase
MNYRHAYHAGNHADVLKHAVLAAALERLKAKPKPFRFIDAHAGVGLYRLDSDEAARTGEWQSGVGRLYSEDGTPLPLPAAAEAALAPWREAVARANAGGRLAAYPGSPWLAQQVLRPHDRLTLNELHPEDVERLRETMHGDRRVAITALDAVAAVKAALPPPERRGLVLIDPPYEKTDEAERAVAAVREGLKRFATGVFLVWYPITGDDVAGRVVSGLKALAVPGTLSVSLTVRQPEPGGGLAGSGVVGINPPWRLDETLAALLPPLAGRLGQTAGAGWSCNWLVPEPA